MDADKIINFFLYIVPAVVTGVIAYYFFKQFLKNEESRRYHQLKKDTQKHALPIRLQAYERIALFLERISPAKLLIRVTPKTSDKDDYETLLIATIEQEFEHNTSQQIYMSDECWSIVNAAKNATIQLIRKAGMIEKTDSANKLREVVLTEMMEKRPPSYAALSYIKKEVGELW